MNQTLAWKVLLIGGISAAGKTIISKRLGLSLGLPWMQVDDLLLAFQRASASLPSGTEAMYYFVNTPNVWQRQPQELCDALIAIGETISAPLEVVIENHVDTSAPIVIEGDGILPSLFSRQSMITRTDTGEIRAVFLVEPDESVILTNMVGRGRGITVRTDEELRTEVHAKWLFGQWLVREAASYNLPVLEPRPWETLADRILGKLA
ncbi:hypothetical protein ACFLXY_07655 [Chloroflexota bacterium]